MKPSLRPACLFAVLLAAGPAGAQRLRIAPPPPTESAHYQEAVSVVAIAEDPDSSAFADALAAALARELSAAGFPVKTVPSVSAAPESEAALARAVSEANRSRWTALARCSTSRSQGRLLWSAAVYDAADGALISADRQGAYGGLSALPLLEQSARGVAVQAAALKDRKIPGKHIDYRIRMLSPDEGATVAFGAGSDSRVAGIVANGELTAPFTAFRAGDPVVITVSKDGYWPKTIVHRMTDDDLAIELPPLMRKSSEAFSLGLATSRLFGVTAEYRRFLFPDSLYVRASDSLWLQYAFTPGSIPVIHDEIRLGAGVYLFRPRNARFRMAMGTGASGIATLVVGGHLSDRFYVDATLEPVWFSWEWHEPAWAVFLDQRMSYSLGLESGLLQRGWFDMDNMPFILTLGVMKKW